MTGMMTLVHDDAEIDIKAMLEKAQPIVNDECCIYRVPFFIRKLNEDAYTPKVVSIGPFHHNRHHPQLHNMERLKLSYCKAFVDRTHTNLDSWIHCIEQEEPKFRNCYSDTLEFSKEELVKIIIVDSGFIFELLWSSFYGELRRNGKYFANNPWLDNVIRYDLLLLENQLPFFILDNLFNLSMVSFTSTYDRGGNNNIPPFFQLTFAYFGYFNVSKLNFHDISTNHFTDLIRTFHLQHPEERRPLRTKELVNHLPSATELLEAGVRFRLNTQSDCLLNLRLLSGRILEIPQLKVEDFTELLLRNMVALEQRHYPLESYITDYVLVLDFLVNTSKDVDILVRKKVLVNYLGDTDSVANLFNGLWKNITQVHFSSNYFDMCGDLNAFCRDPCHKRKSTLRRDYCNTP